jgi:hypothetical protein
MSGVNNSIALAGLQRVLGSLRGANMNSTADQAIPIANGVTKFLVTAIYVTNVSVSQVLSVGGVYSATSKGGVAIVANTQVYSALTGTSTQLLPLTIAAAGLVTALTVANVYFSLTTAVGSASTADVYVVGVDLT